MCLKRDCKTQRISLSLNGRSYPVGSEALEAMISYLPDIELYQDLFTELAMHPSQKIRETVANKSCLAREAISTLLNDGSAEVVQNILWNDSTHSIDENMIIKIIGLGNNVARYFANCFTKYDHGKSERVMEKLFKHQDPEIREALASNPDTPKHILGMLVDDFDINVSSSAMKTLQSVP